MIGEIHGKYVSLNGDVGTSITLPTPIRSKPLTILVKYKHFFNNNARVIDVRDNYYGAGGSGIRIADWNGIVSVSIGYDGTINTSSNNPYPSINNIVDIVVSIDENNMMFYYNGGLRSSVDVSSIPDDFIPDCNFTIGNMYFTTYQSLNGDVYEVAVWNRALTSEEIYDYYDNGVIPREGLVLWFDGDSIDEVNGVWKDKSGNGNDGQFVGNVKVLGDNAKVGRNGLYFDGLTSDVNCGNVEDYANIKTVFIYTKLLQNKSWISQIISKISWSGTAVVGWSIYHTKSKYIKFVVGNGTNQPTFQTQNTYYDNHTIAMTLDVDNDITIGYIDGKVVGSMTCPYTNSTANMYIAHSANNFTVSYNHEIVYFVATYDRVLSEDEIKQLHEYVVDGKGEMITNGLIQWYDSDSIDMNSGIWKDKSGNGNDGIINGAKLISDIVEED